MIESFKMLNTSYTLLSNLCYFRYISYLERNNIIWLITYVQNPLKKYEEVSAIVCYWSSDTLAIQL